MTLRQVFARNVRHLRARKGLSQEQLALEADISRSYMYELERGTYSASLDMVERIAKALVVTPASLLDGHRRG